MASHDPTNERHRLVTFHHLQICLVHPEGKFQRPLHVFSARMEAGGRGRNQWRSRSACDEDECERGGCDIVLPVARATSPNTAHLDASLPSSALMDPRAHRNDSRDSESTPEPTAARRVPVPDDGLQGAAYCSVAIANTRPLTSDAATAPCRSVEPERRSRGARKSAATRPGT